MSEAEIAVWIRSDDFGDRMAKLGEILQRAQQDNEPFPSCETIAAVLAIPVKAVEIMLIGLASELHYAAGGDIAFLPPKKDLN